MAAKVVPSALASSSGAKELIWRNCDTGDWASLCSTRSVAESDAVWRALCLWDTTTGTPANQEPLGLEWQESLPVVKKLRLQLRRLQERSAKLEASLALASTLAPTMPMAGLAVDGQQAGPELKAELQHVPSPPVPPVPQALPVRVLGPEERPRSLWGAEGLLGSEEPRAPRTRLFVNLTTGLELLPRLPAAWLGGELGFCHIRSTHLERSAYEQLVRDLDCSLLFCLVRARSPASAA